MQVAVSAEIPHGQLGEELVGIRARVRFLAKALRKRTMALLIETGADLFWDAVASNVVGKLVDADVASAITVLFEFEEVLFAAGGQQAAHAAGALISRETFVLRAGNPLVMAPLREVSRHLVASDDVKFGASGDEIGDHRGLVAE